MSILTFGRKTKSEPRKERSDFKYPGVRDAMDGNTAVIACEREASDGAGAYPITPSTQMGELWAEAAWSDYEVPGVAEPLRGTTAYMEGRYTFGPRLYAAVRAERNDYPYIQPDEGEWTARNADVRNVEAGIGFRPASHQVVKLSTRLDSWHVAPELRAFLPDGYAVALQFSQSFDVMALVDRARGVR